MARPREFDKDLAHKAAMLLFWRKGWLCCLAMPCWQLVKVNRHGRCRFSRHFRVQLRLGSSVSVQPTPQHQHKRISRVTNSESATPCGAGLSRRKGGTGVVSHDATASRLGWAHQI
jgi:hypothetical protein